MRGEVRLGVGAQLTKATQGTSRARVGRKARGGGGGGWSGHDLI